MTITCEWFDEKTGIIITGWGEKWTTGEFQSADMQLWQYSRQVVGRFDIIADLTQTVFALPIDILRAWVTIAERRDVEFPNWGVTVLVVTDSRLESYFETGSEISLAIRKHCRIVKTTEDAVKLIVEDRKVQAEHRELTY
jgi:hypothetical protein